MEVIVTGGIEHALRLFKERLQRDGILKELREHIAYVKPGERRRRKLFLAASRKKRAQRRWKKP